MREQVLIKALEMHDAAVNSLRKDLGNMQKPVDKAYTIALTHVMMFDVLLTLLQDKGLFTIQQFDQALKELKEKTQKAMDEAAKKQAEEATPKVTVLSDKPAIPVVP